MKRYEKYRQSNIPWIEETPKHWEETKLKYVGYLYSGLTGKSGDDFKQTGHPLNKPFIPFTNIANNEIIDPNKLEFVVIKEEDANQNRVKIGDLFFMMSSENFDDVGKSTILLHDLGEVYLNSFCKGFRVTDKNVNPLYLNFLLLNFPYRKRLMIEANGFTRINLKMEKVNDFVILLPPLEEQNFIAEFLTKSMTHLNKLISTNENIFGLSDRKTGLIQEYRTSLISEVVTGKIKVIA